MRDKCFEEAAVVLDKCLDEEPKDIQALYLSAVCKRYLRSWNEALDIIRLINATTVGHTRALQEEGHIYKAMGQLNKALHSYSRATHANPSLLASWRGQLEILLLQKREPEALRIKPYLERLMKLPPPLVAVMDLTAQGKYGKAEDLCRQFLKKHAHHVEAMRLLADLGSRLSALDDAEFLLESALLLEPKNSQLRIDYIQILRKRQKFANAVSEAEKLFQDEPEIAQHESLYAITTMQIGDYDTALALFDNILKNIPGEPGSLTSKGHALKTMGETARAIESYKLATKSLVGQGEAWYSLANLKTVKFAEQDVDEMIKSLDGHQLQLKDRIYLQFSLGKAYEDMGDFDRSFHYYEEANRGKQLQSRYKSAQVTRESREEQELFTSSFIKNLEGAGHTASDPIFIVGLPRSGSTLLEQILSSHSLVDGTLELPNVLSLVHKLRRGSRLTGPDHYPAVLADLSPEQYYEFGETYLADTQIHRHGAPYFIDKMPNNFRHIGLIKLILPNAKIIDARRHPMACCFSGYKQFFAEGQEFTYDLSDIGTYYRDYVELMDFWNNSFKGQILHVQYEDVVDDLEKQVRRILEYCGLPFESACLEFYETKRLVRTPSSEQVRQPIYRSGVGQWKNYEDHLEPLKKALGPVLDRYPTTASHRD